MRLLDQRPLNTPRQPVASAMLEPEHCRLAMRQRDGVLATGERAFLEALEPVDQHREQHLVADTVDADFGDRAVLEVDLSSVGSSVAVVDRQMVPMVRTTRTWLIHGDDLDRLIQAVELVRRDLAHYASTPKSRTVN